MRGAVCDRAPYGIKNIGIVAGIGEVSREAAWRPGISADNPTGALCVEGSGSPVTPPPRLKGDRQPAELGGAQCR